MSDQLVEYVDLGNSLIDFNKAVQRLNILDGIKDEAYFDQGLKAIIDCFGQVQSVQVIQESLDCLRII